MVLGGLHLNGDVRGTGLFALKSRIFTLEANLALAEVVHEMLLQGWGGKVRIFPAVPEAWAEVSFRSLRCEGAFLVSARRSGGQTAEVRIEAEHPGPLRLADPFAGESAEWTGPDASMHDGVLHCTLQPGQVLIGRRSFT